MDRNRIATQNQRVIKRDLNHLLPSKNLWIQDWLKLEYMIFRQVAAHRAFSCKSLSSKQKQIINQVPRWQKSRHWFLLCFAIDLNILKVASEANLSENYCIWDWSKASLGICEKHALRISLSGQLANYWLFRKKKFYVLPLAAPNGTSLPMAICICCRGKEESCKPNFYPFVLYV